MRDLNVGRYALGSCVAVALLAACGGSQPPIGVPGAMSQNQKTAIDAGRNTSWMLPEASKDDLLYVTGGTPSSTEGTVIVLSYPEGKVVGMLTGLDSPIGECVDKLGNVYVANNGSNAIVEYAHGGTSPIRTLSDPGHPWGCAIDATTGNLAVTNSSGSVAVYSGAQGSPTLYFDSSISLFLFCAYDNHGNLFVDGEQTDLIAELPKGKSTFTDITFNGEIAGASSMQWNDGGLVIVNDTGNRTATPVDRVHISGSTGTVVGTTYLSRHADAVAAYVQYWIEGTKIVGPARTGGDGHDYLGFWRYPAGGASVRLFKPNYGFLWGAVVSPVTKSSSFSFAGGASRRILGKIHA